MTDSSEEIDEDLIYSPFAHEPSKCYTQNTSTNIYELPKTEEIVLSLEQKTTESASTPAPKDISYSIVSYEKEKHVIKLTLPDNSIRYSVNQTVAPIEDWHELPIIKSVILDEAKLWADSLEVSIEFHERSNLSTIYHSFYLLNAEFSEYNLNQNDEILGNKVIEIKSNTIAAISLIRNLYADIIPISSMLDTVLTPMVEWAATKQDSKWKQKIALWFASWSDPSDFVMDNPKTCELLDDHNNLSLDTYSGKKLQDLSSDEQKTCYRLYYSSASQEQIDLWYNIAITFTISSQKTALISANSIPDRASYIKEIPQKVKDKKTEEILNNKDKCLEYIAKVNGSFVDEVKIIATNIANTLKPKDKNYDNAAKNAKDISTLAGVANDILIDGTLGTIAVAYPGVGTAAAFIIRKAIFYGISLTKTASCSYSLISRNFYDKENKVIIDPDSFSQELIYKLTLCKVNLFSLLDDNGKKLLESTIPKLITKTLTQDYLQITNSTSLLEVFSNSSYIENSGMKNEYETVIFRNETFSFTIKDFLYYNASLCYDTILSGLELNQDNNFSLVVV